MSKLTEFVELPSRGLLYNQSSSLSSGKIEIRYMTAEHEDILTNVNYIKNRTVIDKLLQSLIVEKINYNDLLVGDKNTIMIASRILGYGKDYSFNVEVEDEDNPGKTKNVPITVDLTLLNEIVLDKNLILKEGVNEFKFTTPTTGTELTFKLLTHGDEVRIDEDIKGYKKIGLNSSPVITTRLSNTILSVDGKRDIATIRQYVKEMPVRDSKAFREYIAKITPNTILKYTHDFGNGHVEESIPIDSNFFWPE